jgi:hypothetical protein
MPTISGVYDSAQCLTPADRLRLAARLLEDVIRIAPPFVDPRTLEGYSDEWSEEDMREFAQHSLRYAAELYDDEADLEDVEEASV